MPELPEVETTRRALLPHAVGQRIAAVAVRTPRLRQPIDARLPAILRGHTLHDIERRAKYLLFRFAHGTLIVHLGMSGSLRIVPAAQAPIAHEHLDLQLTSGQTLRLRDPRRFGLVLWHAGALDESTHPLFAHLGVEPLAAQFNAAYLHERARGRRIAIKPFLMDQQNVVGVGNIYASESLFRARIHPNTAAGRIRPARLAALVDAVQETLRDALAAGGSTLRDFVSGEGRPGYFQQSYAVYDRTGLPCPRCGTPICHTQHARRSTYYCPHCQH